MLACDLAVAAETARFGVPEVKRGLVAGAGAALRLPERVPLPIALELLLTGDPIDAARAAELGLVNRVTAEGGALDGALELAATIAANGPLAVEVTRQIARGSRDWSRGGLGPAGRADGPGVRVRGRPGGRAGVRREAAAGLEGPLRQHRRAGAQAPPPRLPTITAIGGITAAITLITTAAVVDQNRTTFQASTMSAMQVPISRK